MSRDLDSGRHGLYRKLEFCSKNQRAQVTISQLVSTGYFEVFIRGVSFIEFFIGTQSWSRWSENFIEDSLDGRGQVES